MCWLFVLCSSFTLTVAVTFTGWLALLIQCVQFTSVAYSIGGSVFLEWRYRLDRRQYKSNCRTLVDKSVTYSTYAIRLHTCLTLPFLDPFIFTAFIRNTMRCIFMIVETQEPPPSTLWKGSKSSYFFSLMILNVSDTFVERKVLDERWKIRF